ncbi:chromosome partitioning protein ParB [Mangrovibacter sp. MFB070]|uniref:ParB family protein n=1 Tax=Mangrovibacter sp. MFB070 TaxID=1224318 RepID=UPI0004D5F482|nr:ParB family protein [Mangrovibacter sp. MFB070]KEA50742.1 chromosome partitioning protein ParB [Mangrovibacter sp. MFB070]
MSGKRSTIGRTLNQTSLNSERANPESLNQTFVLASGKRASFSLRNIPANEVIEKTFVVQETNGRDQSALTPESLKDITRTLKLQQFFPCIGVQSGDKIEIIDGSRRRASAILCHVGLNVMVTNNLISSEDARKLARDIQTAREHNIREIGFRLLALKNAGLSQKEIAEQEGLSQAKVTRALQAASVPQDLISLFPVQSELAFSDYKVLISATESLDSKNIGYDQLVDNVGPEVDVLLADEVLAEDEVKNRILKVISREASVLSSKPDKDKSITTMLWTFSDKDRYARKRSKGRMFSYEFNRLPKELQDELDSAIEQVLKKQLS